MSIDLNAIHRKAIALLAAIEGRDALAARLAVADLIAGLPSNDFADPAPGVTICTMPEYSFRAILPRLRGTARMWGEWLETTPGDWPEPVRLRDLLQAMVSIVGQSEAVSG